MARSHRVARSAGANAVPLRACERENGARQPPLQHQSWNETGHGIIFGQLWQLIIDLPFLLCGLVCGAGSVRTVIVTRARRSCRCGESRNGYPT
jgi:hypothetical protein